MAGPAPQPQTPPPSSAHSHPFLSSPQGFGNVAREHWLGNEAVHSLTSRTAYLLRVELHDWEGHQTSIQYENFQLGSERQRYRWAWGPGLWAVWGPKASGCRACPKGHSLGVSYFHHLAPIWVHVTGIWRWPLSTQHILDTGWGGKTVTDATVPRARRDRPRLAHPIYRSYETWTHQGQPLLCSSAGLGIRLCMVKSSRISTPSSVWQQA